MNTNQKGTKAELWVAALAADKGYNVSFPAGDCPYDLVIDKDGILFRVQVKHVSRNVNPGTLKVSLGEEKKAGRIKYSKENVDALVLYDPVDSNVYWVPINEFEDKTSITLRLLESKNKQMKGIRYAKDYLEW